MQNAVYMFTVYSFNCYSKKGESPICLDTIILGVLCNGERTDILDLLGGGWDGVLFFSYLQ